MEIKIEDLTEGQRLGVSKIKDFLSKPNIHGDDNSRVIVLQGQAGTGKTTMLKLALKDIIGDEFALHGDSIKNKYEADLFSNGILGCVGVAVSHKAKKVLGRSIPICTTFASYFGLAPIYDEHGNQKFVRNDNKKIVENALMNKPHKVVCHDEVSMYDLEMIQTVLKDTDPMTKIIFIGDAGQLPPINQEDLENGNAISDDDSPVFSMFANIITLTEKVRQAKGNPIIELTDYIHKEIHTSKNLTQVLNMMADSKILNDVGYQMLPRKEFIQTYTNITTDFRDSKILAYKNDTVDLYNNIVRNYILKNPGRKIINGELIYMRSTYVLDRFTRFLNSEEYILQNPTIKEHHGIECYEVSVDSFGYQELSKSKNPVMYIPTENGDKQIKQKEFFMNKNIKDNEKNYKLKIKFIMAKYKFLENFAKVSYGYCFTVYKAQGSTYRNMFIDVNDILSLQLSDKRKLQAIYTAITRASHLVYFLY